MYREFGSERMPIPVVREALVKAMVCCEEENNRPPVNVKFSACPQRKKFLVILITICVAVIVGVTLVLLSSNESKNTVGSMKV